MIFGSQETIVPSGFVGLPPICTVSPKHIVAPSPASAKGIAKIVTIASIEAEGQLQSLIPFTVIIPVPALPHVTLTVVEPCPEFIVPPVTTQLKVYPFIVSVV